MRTLVFVTLAIVRLSSNNIQMYSFLYITPLLTLITRQGYELLVAH